MGVMGLGRRAWVAGCGGDLWWVWLGVEEVSTWHLLSNRCGVARGTGDAGCGCDGSGNWSE